MRDGASTPFDPADLDLRGGGAALSSPGEIEVRAGDRSLFTATEHGRGVNNGTPAQCVAIEGDLISLQVGDRKLELFRASPCAIASAMPPSSTCTAHRA